MMMMGIVGERERSVKEDRHRHEKEREGELHRWKTRKHTRNTKTLGFGMGERID